MATYYVNTVAGSNTNNGTTYLTPFKNMELAVAKAISGDIVYINAPATNPVRATLYSQTAGVSFAGYNNDYCYIMASRDISHDAEDIEHVENSNLDAFISATVCYGHTFTKTSIALNTDPTYYKTGPGSLKIWRGVDGSIYGTGPYVYLIAGEVYTFRFSHKDTEVGVNYKPSIYLRYDLATDRFVYSVNVENCADNGVGLIRITATAHTFVDGTHVYIKNVSGTTEANGAWVISVFDENNFDLIGSTFSNGYISGGICGGWSESKRIIITNTVGAWEDIAVDFVPDVTTLYKLVINYETAGTNYSYIDNLSIKRKNTFSWSLYGGTTYKIDQALETVYGFAKCLKTDWTNYGCESLEFATPGHLLATPTTKDTLAAGHWVQDSGYIYYRLGTGETNISDIHFEAGRSMYILNTGAQSNGVYVAVNNVNLSKIKSYCGNDNGFSSGGATTGNVIDYCEAYFYLKYRGFNVIKTTITNSKNYYSMEGFEIATASGGSCTNCYSYKAGDEGFQIVSGGDGSFIKCIAIESGWEGNADNSGFSIEGAGSDGNIYNCISYKSYGRGISVDGNGTINVINCISIETVSEASADFYATVTFTGTLTHTNNMGGGYDVRWVQGATEYIDDPEFIDAANGDFRLLPTSPCRDTGVVIAGIVTDYEGKPIPMGSAPDIGAYEFSVSGGLSPGLGLSGGNRPPWWNRRR